MEGLEIQKHKIKLSVLIRPSLMACKEASLNQGNIWIDFHEDAIFGYNITKHRPKRPFCFFMASAALIIQ
jgi:hypothetical protein